MMGFFEGLKDMFMKNAENDHDIGVLGYATRAFMGATSGDAEQAVSNVINAATMTDGHADPLKITALAAATIGSFFAAKNFFTKDAEGNRNGLNDGWGARLSLLAVIIPTVITAGSALMDHLDESGKSLSDYGRDAVHTISPDSSSHREVFGNNPDFDGFRHLDM